MDSIFDVGPQNPKDPPFTARSRFHQSWYRAHVLGVPYGTGPTASSRIPLGSMLQQKDGERGLNFLSKHILQVVRRRLAEPLSGLDVFGIGCNLLSSPTMGFNLLAPLVDQRDLATAAVQTLVSEPVHHVNRVMLSYIARPPQQYLNDQTRLDALVEYTRQDDQKGFAAITTRLADPLSAKAFSSPAYKPWVEHEDAPWLPGTWAQLLEPGLNTIWREHLLATALRLHPARRYASGCLVCVYHPQDTAYIESLARYRALLKPDDASLVEMPLDRLISLWQAALPESQRAWLAAFGQRYLDYAPSEADFQALPQPPK